MDIGCSMSPRSQPFARKSRFELGFQLMSRGQYFVRVNLRLHTVRPLLPVAYCLIKFVLSVYFKLFETEMSSLQAFTCS